MSDPKPLSEVTADLTAGVTLCQLLLVRYLEKEGVLEKGGFQAVLEEHMNGVSPKNRTKTMYAPVLALIAKLGRPEKRKH